MLKIQKALWHIENRLGDCDLNMEDVARAAGVSRFHLSRLFATAMGRSAIAYARGRRLTEAARVLASGAPDILAVAVSYGYSSHEAFTRAFKDQFGVTPEAVRELGSVKPLECVEAWRPCSDGSTGLTPPRFASAPSRLFAGINVRYSGSEGITGIPLQWRRFAPYFALIRNMVSDTGFGINHSFEPEGAFRYLCSVEVSRASGLPPELETIRVREQDYAVFTHRGHINSIPLTMTAIWEQWLPGHGHEPADCSSLEVYGERFHPETGEGEVEIWVPIETKENAG